MSSIASLRRNSASMLDKIKQAAEQNKKSYGNENLWKPYLDEDKGIGQAILRFLPAPQGEELPTARVFSHGFKGPNGKWYIENSLTTLGQDDPVSDLNNRLWNSGVGVPDQGDQKKRTPDQKQASAQKRKEDYFCNVLVISDPGRPQNEGKVFEFRFGPKIYEMLELKMSPKFAGDSPVNPFCMFTGCTFNLRAYRDGPKGKGFWKYDQSKFDDSAELIPGGTDEQYDALWKQCKSIKRYLDASNFKTYDVLQKKLVEVLGPFTGSGVPVSLGAAVEALQAQAPVATPAVVYQAPNVPVVSATASVPVAATASVAPAVTTEDPDLVFFQNAAKGNV